MSRKERKNQIKSLKMTNPAFSKGAVWTKLAVVLCLMGLSAMQGYLYWYTESISEIAMIHLALQSLAILLILTGKGIMIWGYGLTMLASFAMACWMQLETPSQFYQIQMIYFLGSFLVMMFLVFNASAKTYRKELADLKKKKQVKDLSLNQQVNQEHSEQLQTETISEAVEKPTLDPAKGSEKIEVAAGTVKVIQNEMLQVSCPMSVQLNYGSFSRFLVQHYPFVYLHPQFNIDKSPFVQMCIAAEGFDKASEDLYSGEFQIHQTITEHEQMIWIEYTNEMSRLCALICADWLVMQKGTLIHEGINVSQELMKQLTEAFVLAKDAEKIPFEGFIKQG